MIMDYPLVSIITVNFDHPEVTCQLLSSLRKVTYPNIEIIVVDNASPNDDPSIIRRSFPEITFFRSSENLGFAGGNNLGIRHAKGDYILFLNNDIEVEPGFLEPLVRKLISNPGIGAVSPKIKYFYRPDLIQYSGYSGINPYTIRSRGQGFRQKDDDRFNRDAPTAFVHGAAMLVPKEVIRKVGLMAECYFLYYEELDWGFRIRKAGYRLWYVHNSVVFHKESVSTGKLSPAKIYYMNRARLIYLRRNIRGITFLVALLYQAFIAIPKNAVTFLVRGRPGYFRAYRRAIGWHLQNLSGKGIFSNPTLDA